MGSYAAQAAVEGNPPTQAPYTFPGKAYPPADEKPPAYVAPPLMGYPVVSSTIANSYQAPVQTTNRGDGFWRGCCAALCCCCLLEMCF